jgi:uncharacterized damage-inducible protein DinB
MNRTLIETYRAAGPELAASINGLTERELVSHPVEGTWSIRDIFIHMMDSDLIASDRMKRIASMDRPLLVGYDETGFSKLAAYQSIDLAIVCDIFDKNRQLTAAVLGQLPDESFERVGIHTENGKVTLAGMVQSYINHWEHHRKFIRDKRAMLGKPIG